MSDGVCWGVGYPCGGEVDTTKKTYSKENDKDNKYEVSQPNAIIHYYRL